MSGQSACALAGKRDLRTGDVFVRVPIADAAIDDPLAGDDPEAGPFPRTSEGLYLLQRVRDEAHRFAITFHRERRSKRMTASALDAIPGLGATRRKALLTHFGSLKRLADATAADIAEVPGIGRRTAQAIVAALNGGADPAASGGLAPGEAAAPTDGEAAAAPDGDGPPAAMDIASPGPGSGSEPRQPAEPRTSLSLSPVDNSPHYDRPGASERET